MMYFSKIVLATLLVGVSGQADDASGLVSTTPAVGVAEARGEDIVCEEPKQFVDQYEVLTVGVPNDKNYPMVKVSLLPGEQGAKDSLIGNIFLEFNSEQLTLPDRVEVADVSGIDSTCPPEYEPITGVKSCKKAAEVFIKKYVDDNCGGDATGCDGVPVDNTSRLFTDGVGKDGELFAQGCILNVDNNVIYYNDFENTEATVQGNIVCTSIAGSEVQLIDDFVSMYIIKGENKEVKCGKGKLDTDLYDQVYKTKNYNEDFPAKKQDQCYPVGRKGEVIDFDFKIKDIATVTVEDEDRVEFCVRVGYEKEINKEKTIISYIDTKITGTLELKGGFNTFTQDIGVEKVASTKFNTAVQKEVKTKQFLCRRNKGEIEQGTKFINGQNFRICVKSDEDAYEVVAFTSITCGVGDGIERNLYKEAKSDKGFTSIDDKDDGSGIIIIKSVVTSSLVKEAIKGSGSIECVGAVSLKKVKTKSVATTAPGAPTVPPTLARNLQEASVEEESLTTPFSMKIDLDIPYDINIESSAPFASSMTTTTSVAVIGFGSIISFVFSMIL